MILRRKRILVADLLCGAGGSSTGCKQAIEELGMEMVLTCLNHSRTAIETHSMNHPEARHYCQDIATVRPHIVVPEGYLDLLLASPTCTHHSNARGGKPTSDQERSDPWHILSWFTELRVKRAIIENVWEFIKWGPVDRRTSRPIKSREGEYFEAWVAAIWRLGATSIEYRKLNAADYGEATTRERFIMMIRFDRKPIIWPTRTHAKVASPSLKRWRPAKDIIDWSIKGTSIFTRRKPLVPNTLDRIYDGAIASNWPEPFLVILRNHMAGKSIHGPLPTIAAKGTHIGLAQPILLPTGKGAARSAKKPLHAITTGGAGTVVRPGCARPMLVEPIILNRHGDNGGRKRTSKVSEPSPTATTSGAGYLIEPVIISTRHSKKGAGPRPRGVSKPLATVTAVRGSQFSIAEPVIINGRKNNKAAGVSKTPVPALDTKGGVWLAEPFVLSQASGGAARKVSKPIPTTPTGGAVALISPYYSSGSGETCQPVTKPLPAATSKARFGIVVPITHSKRGNKARVIKTDPLPTITTANRGEMAFVEGVGDGPWYDILYRMLQPHELAAAMGFNDGKRVYKFAGNKTEQIKQIGNAVSVKKMKACVRSMLADAAPARRQIAQAAE